LWLFERLSSVQRSPSNEKLAKCEVLAMEADADFTALLVKLWKNSSLFQVNRPLAPGAARELQKVRLTGQ